MEIKINSFTGRCLTDITIILRMWLDQIRTKNKIHSVNTSHSVDPTVSWKDKYNIIITLFTTPLDLELETLKE